MKRAPMRRGFFISSQAARCRTYRNETGRDHPFCFENFSGDLPVAPIKIFPGQIQPEYSSRTN